MTRTGPSARRGARAGMTMLEVVLAVVLLALVAATFATAHSYIYRASGREGERLGAAELANRMMLQFIDDKNALPSQNAPLDYNKRRYNWSLDEVPVRLELNSAAAENESDRAGGLGLDRVRMIVVRVWLSEESGGSVLFTDSVPGVTVTRLYDPIGFGMRSPDALERKLGTDEGVQDFIYEMMQMMGGTQSGSTEEVSPGAGGSP